MSAQKAEEQSMEEILASIRKIISEDSKDEPAKSATVNPSNSTATASRILSRADASIAPPPPLASMGIFPDHRPPENVSNMNSDINYQPVVPPVLVERREYLGNNGAVDSGPQISSPPPEVADNAPLIKPMVSPSVSMAPLVAANAIAGENLSLSRNHHTAPAQPEPARSPNIPGFVENMPEVNNRQYLEPETHHQPDVPLHPAIANAKAYVNTQAPNRSISQMAKHEQTPVFTENSNPSLALPSDPLISPDSVERRAVEERRNHPLRRGADRDEDSFNSDLMSPLTNDSVRNSFEQLKTSATENLDKKVEEMLRPMLREWLDNNLPSMVERLVRDEIERVSRGE